MDLLYANNNQLLSIDVSNNLSLKRLLIQSNNLIELNVTVNTLLERLDLSRNNIEKLDLSSNIMLKRFLCARNEMKSLNVKNGNNTLITQWDSRTNPDLICIEVDDPSYSVLNWIRIDPNSSFSTACGS